MTRLPHLEKFIGGLRARGIVVELNARSRPRVVVPPGVELTDYEREVLRGQSDHIAAMLGGDVEMMVPQGFHECETPDAEPEQKPEPEVEEPEQEEPPPVEAAPVVRSGALWSGDAVRPDLRARDREPTREDWMNGLAVSQRQPDGMFKLVWADPHASREMSLMLKRLYGG